jgi:single-strand DNA-binding protein
MARSMNRATLIGRVGIDPELRSTNGTGSNNRVATFSLATTETWKGEGGTMQEKTEWHRVVVWNRGAAKLADFVEQYVKKGALILVEGKITYRQWQDREGQTRYATEIAAREIMLLGAKRSTDEGQATEASTASTKTQATDSDFPALDDDGDDLPF